MVEMQKTGVTTFGVAESVSTCRSGHLELRGAFGRAPGRRHRDETGLGMGGDRGRDLGGRVGDGYRFDAVELDARGTREVRSSHP